ncbi:hypothetical protein B0H11DRAFT_9754 [Mycena galericulata]|nr:hypothetical protein B0H11DRAFT_9754 [Mycena galericulata]
MHRPASSFVFLALLLRRRIGEIKPMRRAYQRCIRCKDRISMTWGARTEDSVSDRSHRHHPRSAIAYTRRWWRWRRPPRFTYTLKNTL